MEPFVKLHDYVSNTIKIIRYATPKNFTGKVVPGYEYIKDIWCTREAALALQKVAHDLALKGYSLVVYDGYRPQRSVDSFSKWASSDDESQKNNYYPYIDKEEIIPKGYIATKSSHSRGSTFDLSIIENGLSPHEIKETYIILSNNSKIPFLDDGTFHMGTSFDYFGEESWHDAANVPKQYLKNRSILRASMLQHGFQDFQKEWWHYTLKNEPYPDKYFDWIP